MYFILYFVIFLKYLCHIVNRAQNILCTHAQNAFRAVQFFRLFPVDGWEGMGRIICYSKTQFPAAAHICLVSNFFMYYC